MLGDYGAIIGAIVNVATTATTAVLEERSRADQQRAARHDQQRALEARKAELEALARMTGSPAAAQPGTGGMVVHGGVPAAAAAAVATSDYSTGAKLGVGVVLAAIGFFAVRAWMGPR